MNKQETTRDTRPPRVGEGLSRGAGGIAQGAGAAAAGAGEGVGSAAKGAGEAVEALGHVAKRVAALGEDGAKAILTHDVTETSPTPLSGEPAALKVDEVADPGATNAPKVSLEEPKGAPARVPEVGGESAFGMNAKPELGDAVEYKAPPSNLPGSISAREVERDAADYVNGRFGNVSTGAR